MSITDKFQGIKNLLSLTEEDVTKAANGNNAAGTRVRKAMQQLKVMAKEVRDAVQEQRKGKSNV